jgi:prepilin-type N-terminal cleavage/methylation domain-containing protein
LKSTNPHLNPKPCAGFTLLELIVAMVLLVVAMSIVFEAFTGTTRAWRRGTEVADGIKHGDFAMNQLAAALNSTVYFYNPNKSYAFTFEKGSHGGLPADTITFVTASSAFMPEGSPLQNGPHRIMIYIDDDENGDPALFAKAVPALADIEEFESEYLTEPHMVSRAIQGIEILLYDEDTDDWTASWEKENSVPERVKIQVYVPSDDDAEDPLVFTRILDIPVAESVKKKLTGPSNIKQNNTTGGRVPSGSGSPAGGNKGSGGTGPSINVPKR